MGTQEPAERITAVGVALFRGLAVGDLLFYTPLLGAGLAGHLFGWSWGGPLLAAALGITVYRPIACLATVRNARGTPGWTLPKEASHRAVLPAVARWGARGHWHLAATA